MIGWGVSLILENEGKVEIPGFSRRVMVSRDFLTVFLGGEDQGLVRGWLIGVPALMYVNPPRNLLHAMRYDLYVT